MLLKEALSDSLLLLKEGPWDEGPLLEDPIGGSTLPEDDVDKMTGVAVLPCSVEAGTEDVVGFAGRKGDVPFSEAEIDALTKVAVEAGVCD